MMDKLCRVMPSFFDFLAPQRQFNFSRRCRVPSLVSDKVEVAFVAEAVPGAPAL